MKKAVAGLAGVLSAGLLGTGALSAGAASATVTPAAAPAATVAPAAPAAAAGWQSAIGREFPGEVTAVTSVRYSGKTAEFAFGTSAELTMYSRSGSGSWAQTEVSVAKPTETAVAATAIGPNEVYVFTKLGNGTSRVLKGNGHSVSVKGGGRDYYYTWSVVRTFSATIGSATVLSPTDIWVFGSAAAVVGLGTWHFNGTKWTQVSRIMLQGSATAANSAWAVAGPTVAHFNGAKWAARNFAGALPRGEYFVSVDAYGNGAYLVASGLLADAPNTITILQYNGHTWKKAATAGTGYAVPGAISGDGHGGIWFTTYAAKGAKAQVLHYANGAAKVTASTLPGIGTAAHQFLTIAQIPGTTEELTGGSIAHAHGYPASYATLYQYS